VVEVDGDRHGCVVRTGKVPSVTDSCYSVGM
jgi:hypothetical protein